MKNIIFAIAAMAIISYSNKSIAQEKTSSKTTQIVTVHVDGNCGDCKTRIENAAYIKGVKRAEWDKKTKELKLVYNSKKTTLEKVEQSIADQGHDAGTIKATKEAYDKLPACCAYHDVDEH